jgi:hypothetical protein
MDNIMKTNMAAVLFLIFSFNAYSAIDFKIDAPVESGNYAVGIGSTLTLKSEDKKLSGPAVFLGNAVKPDGDSSYQMFLLKDSKKVYYVETTEFTKRFTSKFQTILDPYEQAGGTCTGYAIYDFLQQTNNAGFEGTGELSKTLSTEEGRTNLLVDSINQYYLTVQHRFSISGILNAYGKKFGFKCASFKSEDYSKIKTKILKQLKAGYPVLFSFDIGPKMVQAPFSIDMTEQKNGTLDSRLWVPRKIGERNNGGHSIVAAASFEFEEKTYLVMIDSDWSEPRIWDMDAFLNQKTDLGAVEFTSCK